ncbi:MAG: HNH endonuclease [Candidatus Sulfotelmatobacter sp.]
MTSKFFPARVVVLFCTVVVTAQQAQYKQSGPALLPDPSITKGALRLSSKAKICAIKWGKDERHVTQKMKDDAYAQYGTAPGEGVCALKTHTGTNGQPVTEGCEVDHLISRDLGGADTLENLWPQPYTQHPGAREKDWLETELHKEVCAGKTTLQDAQNEIKTDWYGAYLKRKSPN